MSARLSLHEKCWKACYFSKETYIQTGGWTANTDKPDCSCGCKHFVYLQSNLDWGVCLNPKSPYKGMLLFEHMGCGYYGN